MRHQGYSSDNEVPTSTMSRRKRRDSCQGFTCVTPWVIFFHWFDGNKSRRSRKCNKERAERRSDGSMFKGSINCEASSYAAANLENWKEPSFNLGVGFGLVYLVAARTNEVNKLVELHHNLEILLQNLKTEFQIKGKQPSFELPSHSNCGTSFSNTRLEESSFSNTHLQESSFSNDHDSYQHSSSHNPLYQHDVPSGRRFRGEKSLRMDQIEAEIASEFDRLSLQVDTEMISSHSKQQYSEVNVESCAQEDYESTTFEDVYEPVGLSYNEYYSVPVPAMELERRLHEVLEERQHERISELESALECAMHHLEQKERELCWWKDTARVISRHMPDIPNFLMKRVVKRRLFRKEESGILSLTYEKSLA